jgi:DNA integrity scanning protein DisA with diadenylate cyclase activity
MEELLVNTFFNILESKAVSLGLLFIEHTREIDHISKVSNGNKLVLCTSNDEIATSCLALAQQYIKLPEELAANQEIMKLYCIIKSISKGMCKPDSKIILCYGEGQYNSTIELLKPEADIPALQAILEIVSEKISSIEVFLSIFELAFSLASARHPFVKGTMITVGDHQNLMLHCRPFMFEPFQYYEDKEKSVLNQSIWKTIERYSRLDAAFVLDESGCIQSIVDLITPPTTIGEVSPGLGSRHSTAASISGQFNCYVLVVSQTAGDVSLFLRGKRILKLKN